MTGTPLPSALDMAVNHGMELATRKEQDRIAIGLNRLKGKWHNAGPDDRPDLFEAVEIIRDLVLDSQEGES